MCIRLKKRQPKSTNPKVPSSLDEIAIRNVNNRAYSNLEKEIQQNNDNSLGWNECGRRIGTDEGNHSSLRNRTQRLKNFENAKILQTISDFKRRRTLFNNSRLANEMQNSGKKTGFFLDAFQESDI